MPDIIMGVTVHKIKAFIIGDRILNWPKTTKIIGDTPIWAESEVDKFSLKNPGTNESFWFTFFWNKTRDEVATKERIKTQAEKFGLSPRYTEEVQIPIPKDVQEIVDIAEIKDEDLPQIPVKPSEEMEVPIVTTQTQTPNIPYYSIFDSRESRLNNSN